MNIKNLQLWEILVPYAMGRKNVQVPYHRIWDSKVMEIAGGMTLMKVSKGSWISSKTNKTHRELMIPVRIACSEEQIKQIAEFTITHYNQEAVFVSLISEKTMIIHRENQ